MIISECLREIHPRLKVEPDAHGWQSVTIPTRTVTNRDRALMALATVRNRRRLGLSPAITQSDLEAVSTLVDVRHAVRILPDNGTSNDPYAGLIGTLRRVNENTGNVTAQCGTDVWDSTIVPLWAIDIVDESAVC